MAGEPISVLVVDDHQMMREVLQMVAEGKASKEIAKALHISLNTVIQHRRHIMDKLGAHSIA
jgi:DNA-binding CsgD family transcriptional regulator